MVIKSQKGLTLLELIIAITIMAVLNTYAAMAIQGDATPRK
ncbi:MAG: prepilin-type N-terminal cleavage/methylation domain-containing protein [Bdellovibrionales bacterium]